MVGPYSDALPHGGEKSTSDFHWPYAEPAPPAQFWNRYWAAGGKSRDGLLRRERSVQYVLALRTPVRVVALCGDLAHRMDVCARTVRDDLRSMRADPRLIFYYFDAFDNFRETTIDDTRDPIWRRRRSMRELIWSREAVLYSPRPHDATLDTYTQE